MNTTETSAIQLAPITVDLTLAFDVGECRSNDELYSEDETVIEKAIERAQEAAYALFREWVEDCTWMLDFEVIPLSDKRAAVVRIYGVPAVVRGNQKPLTRRDQKLWNEFATFAIKTADVIRSYDYQEPVILEAVRDIYREQAEEERERGYRG